MIFNFIKRSVVLCRLPIALFTAYSAVSGHLLGPHPSSAGGVLIALSVFLLAAGASALNQYQDRDIDALMERTRQRPLPAGDIPPRRALFFSLMLIAAGSALLLFSDHRVPALLGMTALLWYNGIYTGLKRLTAFAAVPGAVVGMIPPAIGWSSAGGTLADPRLLAVCFLFFMWQVPHFWLQVLHHGEEYERAGLPSLTRMLNKTGMARMTFVWICSAAVSGLLLPLYGTIQSPALSFLLIPGAALIILRGLKLMTAEWTPVLMLSAFRTMNIYIIIVMSILSLESFLRLP